MALGKCPHPVADRGQGRVRLSGARAQVAGKLTSSNVDPVQARFATCKWAKKVMERATELGVEEPRPVRSFFCGPTVSPKDPNTVSYICTYKD